MKKPAIGNVVAFHGTSKWNVAAIRRGGFKKKTYFAYHMEDALEFGGSHIFGVEFSSDRSKWKGAPDGWQFWTRENIPASAIVSYQVVTRSK